MPKEQIGSIIDGINNIGELHRCDAVLSGYIGSAEQVEEIINAFHKVKAANPNAIYICDPVMGHPDKGCIVADGVKEGLINLAMAEADIITPNLVELRELTGLTVENFEQAIDAVKLILTKGPKKVLVKHLSRVGKAKDKFEMLFANQNGVWHISRPLYHFNKEPVGVGDLTAGLFVANLLNGLSDIEAFEHTANAVNEVMEETSTSGIYELQIIAAREKILAPKCNYQAIKVA